MAAALLDRLGIPAQFQTIIGSNSGDVLIGGAHAEWISGLGGDDIVSAGAGNDIVDAGAGNDSIGGGSGDDLLRGGVGDDYIAGGDGIDLISAGDGNDVVDGGADSDEIWGDTGEDTLGGNAGNDILNGGAGDDWLDGGAGADRLAGGIGNDTYVIDESGDRVAENANEGIDTIQASLSIDLANFANIENIRLTGTASSAIGNSAANDLTGNAAANLLVGLGGNDRIDGGAGGDQMTGGAGDDVYRVDDVNDVVTELAQEGYDRIESSISFTIAASVEYLLLTGTADIAGTGTLADETIAGNAGANRIDGAGGADQLIGGLGNDTYVINFAGATIVEGVDGGIDTVEASISTSLAAFVENGKLVGGADIALSGNALDNHLLGNDGANQLRGAAGNDVIDGGAGTDIALFSGYRPETIVTLQPDGGYQLTGPDGVDVLYNIEFVRFSDGLEYALADLVGPDSAATAFADDLIGSAENDVVDGLEGDDRIQGLGGNDMLTGGDGNDLIDGGTGADAMAGGAGNDIYIIESAADSISEETAAGIDTVRASLTYVLGSALENLTLTGTAALNGTGNALNNVLLGNAGANTLSGADGNDVLDGGEGNDRLFGGNGDDTYYTDSTADQVNEFSSAAGGIDTVFSTASFRIGNFVENLTLLGTLYISATGNGGANVLIGNTGANVIDGGIGNDTMMGGAGNDIYVVDRLGDTTIETADGGVDEVRTSIDWTLASYVENLRVLNAGGGFFNGNALNNQMIGGVGADTLRGFDGNDVLDGGGGADVMAGGNGDDVFYIDNSDDVILEYTAAGSGRDTAVTTVNWTMSANVEDMVLAGSADIAIVGNTSNNAITGNAGSNRIDGGIGSDTMAGGAGDDTYLVDRTVDIVIENAGDGVDTVYASTGFALSANIENLILTGEADGFASGNGLANLLRGNSGANVLLGGAGDDVLEGGGGRDVMSGGLGADRFVLRYGQADQIRIADFVSGTDHIDLVGFTQWATASFTGGIFTIVDLGVEYHVRMNNLAALGPEDFAFSAPAFADNLAPAFQPIAPVAAQEDELLSFSVPLSAIVDANPNDWFTFAATLPDGSPLPGWLQFDERTLTFSGTPANGDVGTITVRLVATDAGGLSGDTLVRINVANTNDVPMASATIPAQVAALDYAYSYTPPLASLFVDPDVGDGLSFRATLEDGSALPGWLQFDPATGTFSGSPTDSDLGPISVRLTALDSAGATASILFSLDVVLLAGMHLVGGELADILTGGGGRDFLEGMAGNDVLDGAGGRDTMIGGSGDDVFFVDNAGDVVIETTAGSQGGRDTVRATVTHVLSENVEVLVLVGVGDINATGNALNNQLIGNDGANRIDGGLGADVLEGGRGDDVYIVDRSTDVVIEAVAGGIDEVRTVSSFTLGLNVENLSLIAGGAAVLNGNDLANRITGGSSADTLRGFGGGDVLVGGGGADILAGGDGDDVYFIADSGVSILEYFSSGLGGQDIVNSSVSYALAANIEALVLEGTANINATGNELNNSLTGNAGANRLDGKLGADRMAGGSGDDTYIVDHAGDNVVEALDSGIDEVWTTVSFTLSSQVENLAALNSGPITLNGNDLANRISGGSGANTLRGFGGADILIGGGGADLMAGGDGDDVFYVDDVGDTILEYAGNGLGGFDTVRSSVSYATAMNVEALILEGNGNINATGNSSANTLTGNSGDNLIIGGEGADVLVGGGGADVFCYRTVSESKMGSIDSISDFNSGIDKIDLSMIDAMTNQIGNNAFIYIGNTAFTGVVGQLNYSVNENVIMIGGDTNGDKIADFLLTISGTAIEASDFIV